MTQKRKERFHELVMRECTRTITPEEKTELEDLQSIRYEQIDRDLERIDPGWREREERRGQILDKALDAFELLRARPDQRESVLKELETLFKSYHGNT